MRNPEDRDILHRFKVLSHIEPDEASAKLALEHARAAVRNLPVAASRRKGQMRIGNFFSHFAGGLTMRQRIAAFGGLGVALVAVLFWAWGGIDTRPLSAMEQMAENVRKVKSMRCSITSSQPAWPERGKSPAKSICKETQYWLAPGSTRIEVMALENGNGRRQEPKLTFINPADKPGIVIKKRNKTFRRYGHFQKTSSSLFDKPDDFARLSRGADRQLGTQEIDGKRVYGFEVDFNRIEPHNPLSGPVQVWLDSQSKLPVLVRGEVKYRDLPISFEMGGFEWNVDLDAKLFEPTPPKDYGDDTPKPPASEAEVRQIADALQIYATASAGYYPREDGVAGDSTGYDLCKMLSVVNYPRGETQGNAGKAAKAMRGFNQIDNIQEYNPDAAYYGKTVGPKDKHKVLLRWKLDDGRYEVIFGDLRSEAVTAERLHKLEGK